jgi:hypothetical protein
MIRLLMIGGVLLGAIVAHARDIYVPPPPTRPTEACHASPEALAACDAERRRWELFKCNRKRSRSAC